MKRFLALLLSACLIATLVPFTVAAESEKTDGYFTYTVENGEATLVRVDSATSGDIVLPDSFEGAPLTAIGLYAFNSCYDMTGITIPASVVNIETSGLSSCEDLVSITVDEDNPVYHSAGNCIIETDTNTLVVGCKGSVIPSDGSVTKIGSFAFDGCENLASVTIPDGVTKIGQLAFQHCHALTSITIPESVTQIGWGAFYACEGLTDVYFENTEGWFADDVSLSAEDLADSEKAAELLTDTYHDAYWDVVDELFTYEVYEDGAYLLSAHPSVSGDVVVPDTYEGSTVTGIYHGAFYGCVNITSVTIPETVEWVGEDVFSYCTALESIAVDENNPCYVSEGNCLIDTESKMIVAGCKSSVIPTDLDLEYIASGAFGGTDIAEITIPESLTFIGYAAFYDCESLTKVYFENTEKWYAEIISLSAEDLADPEKAAELLTDTYSEYEWMVVDSLFTYDLYEEEAFLTGVHASVSGAVVIPDTYEGVPVTGITDYAFAYCENVTSVTIPESVIYIGCGAFEGCEALTDVYFENTENWYAGDASVSADDLADSEKAAELLTLELFECLWERVKSLFTYEVYDEDAYLVRVHPAVSGDVVIPETYEGVPVQGISPDAFDGCVNITGVTIPKGVLYIDSNAFSNCPSLESIVVDKDNLRYHSDGDCLIDTESKALITGCNTSVIPSDGSVTSIEHYAFCGSGISEITIPESVTYIGYRAFYGCESLTDVYFEITEDWCTEDDAISSSVLKDSEAAAKMLTDISCDFVWENYSDVEDFTYENYGDEVYLISVNRLYSGDVVIPDTYKGLPVTGIEYGAFEGCTGVTSVTIPESVRYIGENVFASCSSLESIVVDKDNPRYHSAGNCLIDTEEKILVAGCNTSVIPDDGSVVHISSGAFCRTDITEITIPESVKYIGYGAFYGCESLTDVYFESAENWYADIEAIPANALENSENAALILTQLYADYNLEKVDSVFTFSVYENEVSLYSVHFSASGDIVIPDTYEGLPVTAIDYYAFRNCMDVTSVTIPETVEYIGYSAFENCGSLTDIYFENTEKWYTEGGSPVDPEILEDSESAAKYFIEEAPCLVRREDFEYDIYKDGAYLISVLETVSGDVVIPETYKGYPVMGIAEYAFEDCANITSVSIPKTVTEIESCLFLGCNSLESITVDKDNPVYHSAGNCLIDTELGVIVAGCKESVIPDDGSVSAIGYAAFLGCGFESITIPESVVEIGYGAFGECENLKSIHIPAGVSYIDEAIIVGCSSLETVSVDENNPYYRSEGNCIIETDSKTLIAGCKESVIPTDVEIIGKYAFAECYDLESIDIPESVTVIGELAFAWCYSLKSVTIPDAVEYIGADAFHHCEALESVVFENKTGWFCNGYPVDEEIFDDTETLAEAIKQLDEPLTKSVKGDIDGEYGITANDAIYLLYNVFFGDDEYPISQNCDFDGDNDVTANDAIYLLYHVFFGEEDYPLY